MPKQRRTEFVKTLYISDFDFSYSSTEELLNKFNFPVPAEGEIVRIETEYEDGGCHSLSFYKDREETDEEYKERLEADKRAKEQQKKYIDSLKNQKPKK